MSARRGVAAVVALAAAAALGGALAACLTYDATQLSDLEPLRVDFEPVSEMLGARCGSLDCHGAPARPMRLFHHHGMRRAREDVPGGDGTRQEEHAANFLAVTGLEPERIAEVVASGGDGAEDLVIHGKAYGLMKHDGGQVVAEGTRAARCLASWLEGAVDVEACEAASMVARPGD